MNDPEEHFPIPPRPIPIAIRAPPTYRGSFESGLGRCHDGVFAGFASVWDLFGFGLLRVGWIQSLRDPIGIYPWIPKIFTYIAECNGNP